MTSTSRAPASADASSGSERSGVGDLGDRVGHTREHDRPTIDPRCRASRRLGRARGRREREHEGEDEVPACGERYRPGPDGRSDSARGTRGSASAPDDGAEVGERFPAHPRPPSTSSRSTCSPVDFFAVDCFPVDFFTVDFFFVGFFWAPCTPGRAAPCRPAVPSSRASSLAARSASSAGFGKVQVAVRARPRWVNRAETFQRPSLRRATSHEFSSASTSGTQVALHGPTQRVPAARAALAA